MSRAQKIALLLGLITLGLYLPVVRFHFVDYDDSMYVTQNPMVQQGVTWAGVKWAFTTFSASNWHPLTWLSLMIDCGIFGPHPGGLHLVNALFHAANVALLCVLLFRLTDRLWPAAFVAALFAWHPMHVESVAWISERKDVLSTFFALLALLAYVDYVRAKEAKNPRARVYFGWSLGLFALGLMAKPMVVTLPCVLLLLDFWPLQRIKEVRLDATAWRLLKEKWPFFLLTAASCLLTFLAQSKKGQDAVVSLHMMPMGYRFKNIPVAYATYLWKTFWPAKLSIFYPLMDPIPVRVVVLSVALLVIISGAVWWRRRQCPYLLVGWLWFVGMLVPVIGLVQVGGAALADRYSYLPSVGIFIAVTFGVVDLARRVRIPKTALATAAIVILASSTVAMEKQLHYWRNSITLFSHALAVTSDNYVARNSLGVGLQREGKLEAAATQYRIATQLDTNLYEAVDNLANMMDRLGHPKEGLALHQRAVQLEPDKAFLHNSFGRALDADGQTGAALKQFFKAAELDTNYYLPHAEIAKIYLREGRDAAAVGQLRATLRIAPTNIDMLTYAAQVLAASKDPAIRNGRVAFDLAAKANVLAQGHVPKVLDALGMACAEMGKYKDAQMAARQALKLATSLKLNGLEPIRQRLALYEQHQPWRESFGNTNPVTPPPSTSVRQQGAQGLPHPGFLNGGTNGNVSAQPRQGKNSG